MRAIAIVVPRSGSEMITPQNSAVTIPIGFSNAPERASARADARDEHRPTRSSASFASSDGCTLTGPTTNQRRAPFTAGASTRTARQRPNAENEEYRRESPEPVIVDPRHHGKENDAGERVQRLLDEVRHRVAVAECRRRRGGAEHHHEAERDEGQRHQDEHARLDATADHDRSPTAPRSVRLQVALAVLAQNRHEVETHMYVSV